MRKIVCLVVVFVAVIAFCFAEEVEDKTAAVEKMFRLIGIEKQMKGGFEAMLPVVDQMARQLKLNPSEKEELKNIYRDWYNDDLDRDFIKAEMIELYASSFSLQEIKDLNAFYSTPTGRKYLDKAPALTKAGAKIGMDEAKSKEPELLKRIKPFLARVQSEVR